MWATSATVYKTDSEEEKVKALVHIDNHLICIGLMHIDSSI